MVVNKKIYKYNLLQNKSIYLLVLVYIVYFKIGMIFLDLFTNSDILFINLGWTS